MSHIKEYLGDGVYVCFDGFHVVLTAENGIIATDRVCLEPYVLKLFLNYLGKLQRYIIAGGLDAFEKEPL